MTVMHDNHRQSSPLRILLADDSPLQQRLSTAILTRQGHDVTVANNGQEALDALDDQDFDVVLMDVEMPVMNGLQAVGVIRARDRKLGRRTPVVAVTTLPDRGQFSAAGMDAYLTKPLRPDAFQQTLQDLGLQP